MTPHSTPQDELWVKAPEMQGWVYKRGFAWRKTWTRRWLILQNREIAYYEKRPLQRDLQAVEPRGVATLQRDLQVFDGAAGSGGGGGGGGSGRQGGRPPARRAHLRDARAHENGPADVDDRQAHRGAVVPGRGLGPPPHL